MARKRRKSSKSRRRHRRNGKPMPVWFWPALVGSGLAAVYFWKQSHPGQSLNPTA